MRWILLCLILPISLLLAGSPADAHAKLVESMPAANSVTATSPREIRLTFNERIAVSLSGIDLMTAEGNGVSVGEAFADPDDAMGFIVRIDAPLPPGTYRVRWRTVSADMHKLKGDFAFEIRP